MGDISPELVERMAALVRAIAARYDHGSPDVDQDEYYKWMREAAIMAPQLPIPVDPDLIEARKIAAISAREQGAISRHEAVEMEAGKSDYHSGVVAVLRALKRGRELERALLKREPVEVL